jgi:tetratricopeptide (TPR) repeat protein
LLINLGNAYSRKGDFNSAAAEYKTALKIQPDNFIAHTYLGAALFRLGRTDEACDHLNRAVEINPEFAEAKNYLQSIKNLK